MTHTFFVLVIYYIEHEGSHWVSVQEEEDERRTYMGDKMEKNLKSKGIGWFDENFVFIIFLVLILLVIGFDE